MGNADGIGLPIVSQRGRRAAPLNSSLRVRRSGIRSIDPEHWSAGVNASLGRSSIASGKSKWSERTGAPLRQQTATLGTRMPTASASHNFKSPPRRGVTHAIISHCGWYNISDRPQGQGKTIAVARKEAGAAKTGVDRDEHQEPVRSISIPYQAMLFIRQCYSRGPAAMPCQRKNAGRSMATPLRSLSIKLLLPNVYVAPKSAV